MMKYIYILILSAVCPFVVVAQNEWDALRYSSLEFYGDARFNAMGGSFGSLGANMSALSINPAGIGVYKSSDFSFSPSLHYNATESEMDGNAVTDGKLNLHFSNVGLIGNFNAGGNWKSISVGIGYNRTNNYNTRISVESVTDSSALQGYANELNANGGTLEDEISDAYPFSSHLAYWNYLVNPLVAGSTQYDHVFSNSSNISQSTNYQTRGGSGEVFFALGGNYSDKLYIGGLLGVPRVRYTYDRNYTERSQLTDTLTDFRSFSVHDNVKTTGSGVNFKLGLIFKVSDWVRVGAAFHTPTILSLTDQYETTIDSEDKSGALYSITSPRGSYNYLVITPYRFVSSGSVVVGRHGVINVDYEIVDYSTASLEEKRNSGGQGFSGENRNITSNYRMAQNIRVGGEWRLDPFRLRAGYRYQGNPLKDQFEANYGSAIYSLGAGIKEEEYYFDIAYSLRKYKDQTIVNEVNNEIASTSLRDNYITFTLGFRF